MRILLISIATLFRNLKQYSRNGFTLLELMVVLLIIGLLTALLLPNFSKITSKSQDVAMTQLGHTLSMALETYQLDQGSFPDSASASTLISTLVQHGALHTPPTNPYTGKVFSSTDSDPFFTYTASSSGYSLSVYSDQGVLLKTFNR